MFKRWAIAPVILTGELGPVFPQRYRRRQAERVAKAMTGRHRFGKPRFRAVRVDR